MNSKMKSSFIIVLLLLLCGMSVGMLREYTFVSKLMNWYEAQSYCRQTFTDLATITTNKEQIRLQVSEGSVCMYGWIGLKRTDPLLDTWQWSDGQTPTFFNWASDNSTKYKATEDCVILTPLGWSTIKCSSKHYFFCHRNLRLVKENKTWEEALEYCRTYHTALAFLSLTSCTFLAKRENTSFQTVSVWTGLRFINRKWMWVTGESGMSLLHFCPAPRYRCGAHNFNTNVWENRDCNEKLHFLCY